MKGSGYREPPALARRGDGQTIQLTPLLYLVLDEIDGTRTFDEVGAAVSAAYGKTVTGDNVRTLVDDRLRPAGLVTGADGSAPEVQQVQPAAGAEVQVRRHRPRPDPAADRARSRCCSTRCSCCSCWPRCVVVSWWVLFRKGLASATYEAFDKPGLLLLVVAVTILSAGFHEFGHAAGARRGGATPGAMGAGVYLVWPAFYTDVTDSYRLGRWGRVVTDLGGLYFNAIVAVAIAGVWWATQYDALLLVVATQILQMVRQLTPLVRFDGYHVLADVTGRARPLPPDQADAARPAPVALAPPGGHRPEALGPRRGEPLGAGRGPDAGVLDVRDGHLAPARARHCLGERRAGRAPCSAGRGRTPTSSRCWRGRSPCSRWSSRSWRPR